MLLESKRPIHTPGYWLLIMWYQLSSRTPNWFKVIQPWKIGHKIYIFSRIYDASRCICISFTNVLSFSVSDIWLETQTGTPLGEGITKFTDWPVPSYINFIFHNGMKWHENFLFHHLLLKCMAMKSTFLQNYRLNIFDLHKIINTSKWV